jgi:hypothetical protein
MRSLKGGWHLKEGARIYILQAANCCFLNNLTIAYSLSLTTHSKKEVKEDKKIVQHVANRWC